MRKESEKFREMIKYYLGKLGFKNLKKLFVLDVACGRCNEAEVLLELFGRVKGIDSNPKKIERVQERGLKAKFEMGDARNLSKSFGEKVSVVIVRHPNIFGDDWKNIYGRCWKVTKNDSVLVSTFYSKKEFLRGKELIRGAGYRVRFSGENKFYINSLGFDRYVIVGRKARMGWLKWLFD